MQVQKENIILIIAAITGIFLLAALFMFFYIIVFNERKKRHKDEKESMQIQFRQELVRTGLEIQEQTRKNLAADLHDNIGQLLSLTSMTLGSLNLNEIEKAKQKISDAHELVLRSIRELRQLSRLIHGDEVLKQGLLKGMEQEITWLEKAGFFKVVFNKPENDITVANGDKDLIVFRLLQESVNNIIKHAQADCISIGLKFVNDKLLLEVRDNGIGFDIKDDENRTGGMGVASMIRRSALVGGTMDLKSVKGEGTVICFSIPYP